ncbi:VPA1262 family protein [Marinomonas shanghaiensis]|uniref:VPA1262 family protein n=1 Tax=Marinomonas shanghaiensis TaxID=2202418 RepID=UPI003A91D27F
MNKTQDSMPFSLDDILNDQRIQRLFLEKQSCALQLWVLRIEGNDFVENRIIYGRLLPYSFCNNSWSFSSNDNSKAFEGYRAQVKKLNIYLDGKTAKSVVEKLCSGETLRDISEKCELRFGQNKIGDLFGDTKLSQDKLAFKPIAYLINQDAHPRNSIGSPHASAGAFSASIVQCNKQELFSVQENYNIDLTSMVIDELNQDTGLKFRGHDLSRFGDIELMLFPSIDDKEKLLRNIQWSDDKKEIYVKISPAELHQHTHFQFNLRLENNGQLLYSSLKTAIQDASGRHECTFNVDSKLNSIIDSMSLDIFGATDKQAGEFTLYDRWTTYFIREVNYQIHVDSGSSESNKFDWLEKTVTQKMSDRVAKVLSINNNTPTTNNNITNRKTDPWVPINRSLSKAFKLIYPEKSDGAFFPRWGISSGEGRLQFTEWFKELAQSSKRHSITIFDPHFEDVGLALILFSSTHDSDYTIFRTNNQTKTRGIEALLQACSHNQKLMHQKNINIYGVSDGNLHDRYILVTDNKGLPVKGYHLSNSLQSVAENHPLLITPIPMDVLYKVVEYKKNLLSDSNEKVIHLYSSKTHGSKLVKPNKGDTFFDSDVMGDILSYWLNEPTLKGLKESELINKLKELSLYNDDFPHGIDPNGLRSFIDATDFTKIDFSPYWEAIGELLSRTESNCHDTDYFSNKRSFLDSLTGILKTTFNREEDENTNHELPLISPSYFKQTLSDFLHSSTAPHNFSIGVKQSLLTWSEYYCIQYLWTYDPVSLIKLVDTQALELSNEFNDSDKIRLSVLGQILREICLSIEARLTSDLQMTALLSSKNDFFKWLAWCELDYRVGETSNLNIIKSLPSDEQCTFIGWLINRYSTTEQDANLINKLVEELHQLLPEKLDLTILRNMIDSLRGHMKQLSWAEPWISRNVMAPLINKKRVTFEDASQIWHEELVSLLEPANSRKTSLFNSGREGEVTNIAAWLCANSSQAYQKKYLKNLDQILRKQKQVIQQPLANTANWSNWNNALKVSLWIWLFTEWCRYYNSINGNDNSQKLVELYDIAKELALARPESELLQNEMFLQINKIAEQIQATNLQLSEQDQINTK